MNVRVTRILQDGTRVGAGGGWWLTCGGDFIVHRRYALRDTGVMERLSGWAVACAVDGPRPERCCQLLADHDLGDQTFATRREALAALTVALHSERMLDA